MQDTYTMQKKALGEGSFGSAFKATCKSSWRNFERDWLSVVLLIVQQFQCDILYMQSWNNHKSCIEVPDLVSLKPYGSIWKHFRISINLKTCPQDVAFSRLVVKKSQVHPLAGMSLKVPWNKSGVLLRWFHELNFRNTHSNCFQIFQYSRIFKIFDLLGSSKFVSCLFDPMASWHYSAATYGCVLQPSC